ncbi:MAG TPA: hypothetical protein VGK99_17910 [Acidobacteriota bacterium]|jgi:HEPN domain-containing protein
MAGHRKVEARRWFQQALHDLRAVGWTIEGGFYIPSRYPNGLPSGYPHQFYAKEMADQALKAAEMIVSAIREHYRKQGEDSILHAVDSLHE